MLGFAPTGRCLVSAALAAALRQIAPIMQDLARAVKVGATTVDDKYSSSILFLGGFFSREVVETLECVIGFHSPTVPNELVYVDFGFADDGAKVLHSILVHLARLAVGEVIEGVGKIVIWETPQGFVVLRRSDFSEVPNCHEKFSAN